MNDARSDWVQTALAAMSWPEKVGQLLVAYVSGSTAESSHPENRRRFGVDTPAEAVRALHLGGVIYFGWSGNVDTPEQTAELSNGLRDASKIPLTIAIDQETGTIVRVALTEFPGARALGATHQTQHTYDAYEIVGRELAALGITTDYAPVADVDINPANPVIGVRAFSADFAEVSRHVDAAVRGLQASGVSAVAKHFPGHGDTAVDSHVALPVVTHTRDEWARVDAPPFRAAISAGVDAIMTGHLSFPELDPSGEPATLSHPITTVLLRQELGFDGVVVTDSLRMAGVRERHSDGEAAIRALEAGADVLLDPELPLEVFSAVLEAVRSGRLSQDRINRSVTRVLGLKHTRGAVSSGRVDVAGLSDRIRTPEHLARAQQITDQSVMLLVDPLGLVPLRAGSVRVTGWGESQVSWLARRLFAGGHRTTSWVTGPFPDRVAIEQAVVRAGQADLIIVTTSAVWADEGQRALINALGAAHPPMIVVGLLDASDLDALPPKSTFLVTYSSTEVSLESVARVLEGTVVAAGTPPRTNP